MYKSIKPDILQYSKDFGLETSFEVDIGYRAAGKNPLTADMKVFYQMETQFTLRLIYLQLLLKKCTYVIRFK